MRTEEGLFHPECHKDKDNGMDASNVDTSMEEASSPVKKELIEEEKQEVADPASLSPKCNDDAIDELTSAAPEEETVIKSEPAIPQSADNDVPMEDVEVNDKEEVAVKVEQKEDTDANDNNLDSKENVKEEEEGVTTEAIKTEELMETELTGEEPVEGEESEEKLKHSDSLLEDKDDKEALAVPVVPAKVVISYCNIYAVIVSVKMPDINVFLSRLNEKICFGILLFCSSIIQKSSVGRMWH